MNTDGQSNLNLGFGLARLKAEAANIQATREQKREFVKEQRRDVSNLLIFLLAVVALALNLQMLLSKNLAFSIISLPFILMIIFVVRRRVMSKISMERMREKQLKEFGAIEENTNVRN